MIVLQLLYGGERSNSANRKATKVYNDNNLIFPPIKRLAQR